MDKGVVMTAFNAGDVDYHLIAEANSKLIKHYSNVPVAVITDEPWNSKYIDHFIVADAGPATSRHDQLVRTDSWLNQNRYQVYDLSPFNKTLLLDADFFIGSSFLFRCFDTSYEFLIASSSTDVVTGHPVEPYRVSPTAPPTVWATAVYFSKSDLNKSIFDRVNVIRTNWDFYQTLYQFNSKFRNDYAFAIAIHEVNGGRPCDDFYLPIIIDALMPNQMLQYIADIPWVCDKSFPDHRIDVMNRNLHVLDKVQAQEHARWVLSV